MSCNKKVKWENKNRKKIERNETQKMRSYIIHSIMKKVFLLSNVMLICLYVLIIKSRRLHVQNFHFPQDTSISLCCVWFILDTKFLNCKFTLNFFSFRCFLCKHFVYCIYIYIHLLFPMKNSMNL